MTPYRKFSYFYLTLFLYIILFFTNLYYFHDLFSFLLLGLDAGISENYLSVEIGVKMISAFILISSPLLLLSQKIRQALDKKVSSIGLALTIILLFVLFPEFCISQQAEYFPESTGFRLLPPLEKGYYIENDAAHDNLIKLRENLIKFKSIDNREYIPANNINSARDEELESRLFLLGTDYLGRDLFAMIISGTRVSFMISVTAGMIAALLGIIFGFISGYDTKIAGNLLDRLSDAILAIPGIFFILLLTLFFSSDLVILVLILGFSGWMSLFKIIRTQVSEIKRKDYFRTAKLMGLPFSHLIFREIFPVVMGPIVVNITFLMANIILAEAALSYLGVDFGTSTPTWGQLIEQGQQYIRKDWWLVVFPSLTLSFTIITIYGAARKLEKKFRY